MVYGIYDTNDLKYLSSMYIIFYDSNSTLDKYFRKIIKEEEYNYDIVKDYYFIHNRVEPLYKTTDIQLNRNIYINMI